MSAPTATDAAAPTKGDPFEDTDDTCVDDATFVDAQGLTCADHERWDCEAYASNGRTSYEAATYDELAAVVAADVCADVTITASLVLDSEIELSNNKSDVVLRGAAGVELSGNNGTTRVLSSAGSLTLRDLVITEGAAAGGGSYYDYFDDGDYSIDGGGVYFCGEKLRVWGCDIVGNAAGVSAFWAYYQYNAEGGEGGGLFVCPNSEEVVLGDTTVRSNVAPGDGGGLFVEQPDTLTLRPGTSFDGNKAAGAGGAIYASNYGLVYAGDGVREAARAAAVTFSNNVAMEGDGGAIFATACRVELSNFGGALYLDAASAVKLAESSATGNDGAFEGGFAFIRDGVVDGSGTTAVVGSTSAAGAHVYVSDYGEATIQGLTLADGATTYGGALYCTVGSDCRVRDVASVGNQVTSEGALACVERTALLTLRNVSSAKDGASVGIVSVGADAVLDAVDLRVSDSMVDAEGISASKPHSVFLANATFDRCFAYDYAAVLYSSGGAVSLVDVDILGTYTQWDAGAIELQVAALAANRTTVSGGVGGPALLLKSGVATITDATFSSNECTYGAGVVQTSEGARVVFRNTAFLNNTAEDAAALAATDFSVVNATDCVFAGNAAVFGSGGAASVATSSSLATSRTSFLRNDAAVDAGAVLVAPPAEFVSLGNTTLAGNVAATGDGGAVKISGDDDAIAGVVVLDAAGDLVAGNRAPLGGGGAAYYSPGASPEPRVGRARANEALFGEILATPVQSLAFVDSQSSGRLAAVESGVEVNGSIEVELLDLYGHRVRTSEGDAVILSTDDAGATLTGDISTEVFAGLATFGGVTITKVPGSIVALEATISAAGLVADASVNLTDCVAGEYYNSGVCTLCPRGKVSFEPTDSCHTCPDDATCSGGHALVPDDGYWRSTSLSLNVLKCASDDYCPDSSVDLWNKLNPTSWRAPTASCAYNHAGPRCALCKRDYYLEAETFRCVACEGGGEDTQKLLLFIFAFFAGLVVVVAVGYYAVKHWLGAYVDAMQKTDVFASLNDKWLPFLVPKLKILLVTVQIVGAFGETFSAVDFPDIFAKLTESLSIFGFDPSAFFAASTECDRPQWDFLSKLVSNVIFASLFCDDDYDDEPDGSPFKNGSWLAADYTVSCRSDRYKSHAIYAYICIVIYPVGIPLGFFALLYSVRDSIAPTDYDAFVSKILSGEDRTLALEEPVEVAETDTAEEKAVKRKYSLVPASPAKKSVKASAERVLNAKRAAAEAGDGADHLVSSERFAKVLAVHHKAVEFLHPYVDDSTDRFSTVMSGMVFLQLFLTIMLYAETYIEDDHIRAGWSTKKFGEMMVGLAVASVPAQALIEFCLELEIDLISLIGLAFAALCCVTQAIRLRMSKGEGAAEEPPEVPADDDPVGPSVISLVENAEASLKLERSETRAPADVQSRCLDAPTNAAELPLCFGVDADAAI
ncbi:hypothetical protein JL720_15708 [Aureococcus anophagefferens]|nr:hypothetical protein JL720_15708 [Aureococcus anophagefferens]